MQSMSAAPSNAEPNNPPLTPEQEALKRQREFHIRKWNEHALQLKNLLRFRRKTPQHIMHEEAIRDDADFERRISKEAPAWNVNLQEAIAGFRDKASNPDNQNIKTLIVILGGGMKCAYSAGQIMALNAIGITADKVDAVVGASGGAVVATGYLAGKRETVEASKILAESGSGDDFINAKRVVKGGSVVNLDWLVGALKGSSSGPIIDEDKIRNSKTELYYVVTKPTDGVKDPEVVLLDARNQAEVPSLDEAVKASMALGPKMTGKAGIINGEQYYDGAVAACPIQEIIDKVKPTHVIILPQLPYELTENIKPSTKQMIGSRIAKLIGYNAVAKGLVNKRQLRESLELIKKLDGVKIGIMWPPDSGMSTFTKNSTEFKAAVLASFKKSFEDWGVKTPTELPDFILD